MSFLSHGELPHLISTYGYGAVALIVTLETVGLPLPGESTIIAAAMIAAADHRLDIWLLIAAAAAGAIVGDNVMFWIGREFGYRLVLRFGPHLGLTEPRIRLGQYLFLRYGPGVVFFGRFIVLVRTLAALFAGANWMRWPRFVIYNATGGIAWATIYGLGAYYLGKQVDRLAEPVGIATAVVAAIIIVVFFVLLRREEAALEEKAEAALPGPLRPVRRKRPD
jgi:membrane protein DedA with SNARE-associated domain